MAHDDADEMAGTMASDDAFSFDPFPLLRGLYEAGARLAVMGQVAGILHGSAELTGDLDLLWDGDVAHAPALAAAGAGRERLSVVALVLEGAEERLGRPGCAGGAVEPTERVAS